MRRISALIHTRNADRTLGRTLETARPCDEIVVVDHGSTDRTICVAREYGAVVARAIPGSDAGFYAALCRYDWVLCLLPIESLSEGLEASLFEWKLAGPNGPSSYSLNLRMETGDGWRYLAPQIRLINRKAISWDAPQWAELADVRSGAPSLELDPPFAAEGGNILTGDLLRFVAQAT